MEVVRIVDGLMNRCDTLERLGLDISDNELFAAPWGVRQRLYVARTGTCVPDSCCGCVSCVPCRWWQPERIWMAASVMSS